MPFEIAETISGNNQTFLYVFGLPLLESDKNTGWNYDRKLTIRHSLINIISELDVFYSFS